MGSIRLIKGSRYVVLYAAVKNPLAGVRGISPTMKVRLMRGINESAQSRELAKGDVITFIGTATGWGSDPGIEARFRTEDGFEGEFFPAGAWGDVSDVLLAPEAAAKVEAA